MKDIKIKQEELREEVEQLFRVLASLFLGILLTSSENLKYVGLLFYIFSIYFMLKYVGLVEYTEEQMSHKIDNTPNESSNIL